MARTEILKIARRLPELGRGVSRTTYALNNESVLKVDRQDGGNFAGSCDLEAQAWATLRNTAVAAMLAPVLESGDGWLIMARATMNTLSAAQRNDLERALTPVGIKDLHGGNVGEIAGRPVAIDYAYQSKTITPANVPAIAPVAPVAVVNECADCGEALCICAQMTFLPTRV